MKREKLTVEKLLLAFYIAAAMMLLFAVIRNTSPRLMRQAGEMRDFSDRWLTESGEAVALSDVTTKAYGGSVTLRKTLPDALAEDDAFCFQTKNTHVTVFLDGEEVYRFEGRENLTGKGYGVAFHFVGLSASDAGRTVSIRLDGVLSDNEGQAWRAYLCPSVRYAQTFIIEKMISFRLSVLIIFFSLLLFALRYYMPDKDAMPFDAAALGGTMFSLGLWSALDTEVPLLITGQIYVSRVLDMFLPFFAGYPFICFISSLTKVKRPTHRRIAFWGTVIPAAALLILRYCFGGDMIHLYIPFFAVYTCMVVLLALKIGSENARYYREHKLQYAGLRINLALGILLACGSVDVAMYALHLAASSVHGTFLRFGLALFAAMMLFQFLRWWASEHAAVKRNRFINRALQYAVSANEPEKSIRAQLKYLGTELHAKRTYIFEDQGNGVWHGTYEWFAEGMEPRSPELLDLPYNGLIDELYSIFKQNDRLIVSDREQWRERNPILYETLCANHVERMVVGPLEANGKLIGLFGVDDAPTAKLTEIAEIIRLISFFFAGLVMRREEQKRLVYYSYCDALTGARNRRAFGEFVEEKLKEHSAYGLVMCDLNGLKTMNDKNGHEAGDKLIADAAGSLMEAFGTENVYRMGGDEFAAFGFEADEAALQADVERLKARMAEVGSSASIGAVYCEDAARDIAEVMAEADARMYREKELYYRDRHDRRRR